MRVVFIGASSFGLRCLKTLMSLECCSVVGAVTALQKFSISYRPEGVTNVLHADVASYCEQENIPSIFVKNGMKDDALYETVFSWAPDAFLVVGWYHMIPKVWLERVPAYGLHASLLPDYSGGAPLVWAILNDEEKTGITLFQMDSGVDSGPIVNQCSECITPRDTIASLYARIEERGVELIEQSFPKLADGCAQLSVQDDRLRRIMPQRSPEDGRIDWHRDVEYIDRAVRAQTRPYPGAFTMIGSEMLYIWVARPEQGDGDIKGDVGEVLSREDGMFIVTGKGVLEVQKATFAGDEISGCDLRKKIEAGTILGI